MTVSVFRGKQRHLNNCHISFLRKIVNGDTPFTVSTIHYIELYAQIIACDATTHGNGIFHGFLKTTWVTDTPSSTA